MEILIVSSGVGLFEPKSGSQNRFYNLTRGLCTGHNNITLLIPEKFRSRAEYTNMNEYNFKNYTLGRKELNIFVDINVHFARELMILLSRKQFDVIQIYSYRGILLTKLLSTIFRQKAILVYDAHNVYADSEKYAMTDPTRSKVEKIVVPVVTSILEAIAVKLVDKILAVSEDDKRRFTEKYNIEEGKIRVVPSGVKIIQNSSITKSEDIRKKLGIEANQVVIVFHGSYFYFPNKEAITSIVNYIAPEVGKSSKNALFVIAGTGVPVFSKDNIMSIGFCEDIYSLLNACDIAIVPILGGGGTRLKVLDYLGIGLPVVTTRKGIEGIRAKNSQDALICDGLDREFIEQLLCLVENRSKRVNISNNAKKLAMTAYDWEKIGKDLNAYYRQLIGNNNDHHESI